MISASQIKLIRSLRVRKYRERHRAFMVEGEKMVLELLEGRTGDDYRILQLYATGEWIKGNPKILGRSGAGILEISLPELKKLSGLITPQPVMAMVGIPDSGLHLETLAREPVLAFDAIRDPGNLGTIIRTADWFGISMVLCSPDSVDAYNPKVVQGSMGALFRVRVHYADLQGVLSHPALKAKPVFGTFLEGEEIYRVQMGAAPLILFGNESRGLSPVYDPYIQRRIAIPSFREEGTGTESLNLASSVAVICSELRRP